MPITAADIKLLASARMVDATDGGGQMTGTPLQDGAENNVWPDISSLNFAQGALQLRKVYAAVLQAGADTYLGAHTVIEDLPDDSDVAAVLMPASGSLQTVADLVAGLNNAGEAFGFAGAAHTTAAVALGASTVSVASVRAPLIPRTVLADAVAGNLVADGAQPQVMALAPTGADWIEVYLPQQTTRFPAVQGAVTYSLQLPIGTAPGSERVTFTSSQEYTPWPALGQTTRDGGAFAPLATTGSLTPLSIATGPSQSVATVNLASLDRATGVLILVLPYPLLPGSDLVVTYAEGGQAVDLPATSLVSGGAITGGQANVTPGAGMELAAARFDISGGAEGLWLIGGVIRDGAIVGAGGTPIGGTVIGSASPSGLLVLPGRTGSITNWRAVQVSPDYSVSSIRATLPTAIDAATLDVTGQTALGAAFTASASASGVFATAHVTGTYDRATGALDLTFASSTKLRSLAYSATRQSPQAVFAPLWGIDPSQFADDGTVPVLRAGQIVVLRHTASVAPANYANGNSINCGRTGLADVRLVGANGVSITSGWSANLTTGVVTVADISGWAQPVTVRHAIEHMAIALSVPNNGTVVLSRAVEREFPAGSLLSSALLLGDLQARAGQAFAQETWTGVWQDTRIGAAVAAQYQQTANPIAVRNDGAVTERWAIVFNTSTTFRLIGETLGQIAVGDINTVFAPLNPATGQPYVTIAPQGWGAWSAGNVLRINTTGANAPVWAARVVLPSAPSSAPDSILLAVRGDIDA